MDAMADRYGVVILVLARPVPVFAEASVLLMGTMRIGWWRFLVPVGLSSPGIAAVYAALGDRVQLPLALVASIAVPLVATLMA
jgi:membrane protein DedA with SNARE-associated domain